MNIWEDSNNQEKELKHRKGSILIGGSLKKFQKLFENETAENILELSKKYPIKVGNGILAQIEESPQIEYKPITEKEFKEMFDKLFEDIVVVGTCWYSKEDLEKFNKFRNEKDI